MPNFIPYMRGWRLALSCLMVSIQALAADPPAFMHIDSIRCDSEQSGYSNWCEVSAFSFAGGAAEQSPAAGAARVSLGDVAVVKPIDSGTPRIFQAFAAGTHLRSIELSFVRSIREKDLREYFKIELFECLISKVNYGFGQEGISIWWNRIRMTYRDVQPDGSVKQNVVTTWDRALNRPF